METAFDPYEAAALVYIRLVRRESREAAAVMEQVHAAFGAQAALRTALIIMVMKIEVQQNQWLPYIGLYLHLLDEYPDALPLAKDAMTLCLQRWAVPAVPSTEGAELPVARV